MELSILIVKRGKLLTIYSAFDWLLKQDMKQNPHLYKKTNSDEQGGVKKASTYR